MGFRSEPPVVVATISMSSCETLFVLSRRDNNNIMTYSRWLSYLDLLKNEPEETRYVSIHPTSVRLFTCNVLISRSERGMHAYN